MPIKFEFELDEEDLEFFRRIIEQKALDRPRAEIHDIAAATREPPCGGGRWRCASRRTIRATRTSEATESRSAAES